MTKPTLNETRDKYWSDLSAEFDNDVQKVTEEAYKMGWLDAVAEMKSRAEVLVNALDKFNDYYMIKESKSDYSVNLLKALEEYRKSVE